jgi:peptidyl-prolyl cis-trans isomerase D
MMQVFRNSAKPVIILLTVTMFVWLLVDLSGITGQAGVLSQTTAGRVAGTDVDARQYELAVQQAVANAQRGGQSLGLEGTEQVRDQVWNQIVENLLLQAEFKKRGIVVTDAEVVAALRNAPPAELQSSPEFATDGQFDIEKYRRWLTSASARPFIDGLAAEYRDRLQRAKLFRQVAADVVVTDAQLWEQFKDETERVKIGLAAFLPDVLVPDTLVKVTNTEVEEYYAAHKGDFKPTKTAYLSYIALPRFTDASDTAAAVARAQALREEILAGAPFADVAKRESADSGSARLGGNLGEFGRGMMDPAFEKAAFGLPVGQLSQPVISAFGVHLIEVTKKNGDKVTARHILLPVELAGAHRDAVDAKADSLDRLAAEQGDPAALDKAADALKLRVEKAAPVVEGSRVMAGPLVIPDAGVWASTAKVGAISPVFESPFALYVVRIDSVRGGGSGLGAVRDQVERAVKLEKKKARVEAAATAVLAKVVSGNSLADAAKSMGAPYSEFGPFSRLSPPITDPIVVGAAFGLQPGQTSGLVRSREGGVYLMTVLERQPADSAAFVKDLPTLRQASLRQRQQERVQAFLDALRAEAKIEDNRAKLRNQA